VGTGKATSFDIADTLRYSQIVLGNLVSPSTAAVGNSATTGSSESPAGGAGRPSAAPVVSGASSAAAGSPSSTASSAANSAPVVSGASLAAANSASVVRRANSAANAPPVSVVRRANSAANAAPVSVVTAPLGTRKPKASLVEGFTETIEGRALVYTNDDFYTYWNNVLGWTGTDDSTETVIPHTKKETYKLFIDDINRMSVTINGTVISKEPPLDPDGPVRMHTVIMDILGRTISSFDTWKQQYEAIFYLTLNQKLFINAYTFVVPTLRKINLFCTSDSIINASVTVEASGKFTIHYSIPSFLRNPEINETKNLGQLLAETTVICIPGDRFTGSITHKLTFSCLKYYTELLESVTQEYDTLLVELCGESAADKEGHSVKPRLLYPAKRWGASGQPVESPDPKFTTFKQQFAPYVLCAYDARRGMPGGPRPLNTATTHKIIESLRPFSSPEAIDRIRRTILQPLYNAKLDIPSPPIQYSIWMAACIRFIQSYPANSASTVNTIIRLKDLVTGTTKHRSIQIDDVLNKTDALTILAVGNSNADNSYRMSANSLLASNGRPKGVISSGYSANAATSSGNSANAATSSGSVIPAGGAGRPPPNAVLSNARFITPARNAPAFPNPDQLTVIWVRHGFSCQNLQSTKKTAVVRKLDPELCKSGILHAIHAGTALQTKLRAEGRTPIVGASVLMRAQQTAYLMLGNSLNNDNKIHILPYISESGPRLNMGGREGLGYDNIPLPLTRQREFYTLYMPGILNILDRENLYLDNKSDYKSDYSLKDKTPNLAEFKKFLASNFNKFIDRGLLLFSHGNVIRSLYTSLGKKDDVVNCSAHIAMYRRDGTLVSIEPYGSAVAEPSMAQDPNICLNADAALSFEDRREQYKTILESAGFLAPSPESALILAELKENGVNKKRIEEPPEVRNDAYYAGGRRFKRTYRRRIQRRKTLKQYKIKQRRTRKSNGRKTRKRSGST
jgi:broad specificity phosphatase PhoE